MSNVTILPSFQEPAEPQVAAVPAADGQGQGDQRRVEQGGQEEGAVHRGHAEDTPRRGQSYDSVSQLSNRF